MGQSNKATIKALIIHLVVCVTQNAINGVVYMGPQSQVSRPGMKAMSQLLSPNIPFKYN